MPVYFLLGGFLFPGWSSEIDILGKAEVFSLYSLISWWSFHLWRTWSTQSDIKLQLTHMEYMVFLVRIHVHCHLKRSRGRWDQSSEQNTGHELFVWHNALLSRRWRYTRTPSVGVVWCVLFHIFQMNYAIIFLLPYLAVIRLYKINTMTCKAY